MSHTALMAGTRGSTGEEEEMSGLTACCRGAYSCRWKKMRKGGDSKCACCWFSVLTFITLLTVSWMYICLVAHNDQEDLNWKAFMHLKWWVNWFMVLTITSAVLTSYCVLLLLFALFQVALKEPLDLHWLHKILLFLSLLFISLGIVGITLQWKREWPTVLLSLQATAPFLQFGAVGGLLLLSPFVFQRFHMAKAKYSQFLMAAAFAAVSAPILLCPLLVHSPCLIDYGSLPPKPKLIGHRGAPMLAPENTIIAFQRSVACGVTAFETDVQMSKDGVPFLMHDQGPDFLRRTTDVEDKFPGQHINSSRQLTWEQLQSLNAGEWFLQTDPFFSLSQLSAEDREEASNQTIPSLVQLLHLAERHNVSVLFDLYSSGQGSNVVQTILSSNVEPSLVLWLPSDGRPYAKSRAPGFTQVYDDEGHMRNGGGDHLNLHYGKLSMSEIGELRRRNISLNLWVVNHSWLFSLLWCAGASSVTTNTCHLLADMEGPDWVLPPGTYTAMWITVDVVSMVMMVLIYFLKRKPCCCHRNVSKKERTQLSWNQKELSPFLAAV
ncbi:glycerophosphoinositol inositolphosphodiesterase GDPD2 isoform X2 [Nerophis lumbriciformis]|uniref:glycerophosphoinositol inositolphosphodiesterase GDPD2 isoform X2 n=1 Tax=Nerophis lumbriciformis TaxID=546530 RepID=UPI002AE0668E|nr:glycerophosphoinositol inositolphosphodiesterase GDPD2-like isoform X2 [Nerophis lumbriciformis]